MAELVGAEAIERLRRIARPVMFWTDSKDAPVSVGGTLFVAGLGPSLFLLTAKHVVRDCPVERLLLLPCEGAQTPFHVSRYWNVEDPDGDPDAADMFVMRTELATLPPEIRRTARVLDLNIERVWDWQPYRSDSTFFVFGFPKAFTTVDYYDECIDTSQAFLQGAYVGPSFTDGCHEILLQNPHNLESFDGFSGSPVFCTHNQTGTRFCGLAIRGSATEGRLHFIGAHLIMDILDQANDMVRLAARPKPESR